MSDLHEPLHEPLHQPLHQPPNPDDLRRVRPTSPDCAKVRGWMRDFVDGDLSPPQGEQLEVHVHGCRVCAVELARAEHEVLRVRSAFATSTGNSQAALPVDFATRVVERLILDETSLVSKEQLAAAGLAAAGFAAATAASAQLAAKAGADKTGATIGSESSPRDGRLHPAFLLVGAFLMLVAFGTVFELFDGVRGPQGVARLVVIRADGTFAHSRELGVGDGLGERQSLRVVAGGGARLDWHDMSARHQPAATLQVHGDSEVRLEDGAPMVSGQVDVVTNRPVSIPMADGSQLDLGIGDYAITATAQRDLLGDSLAPGQDPMLMPPQDLLIQVEVRAGEPAAVLRAGSGPTLIANGQVGVYQGAAPIAIGPSHGGPTSVDGWVGTRVPSESAPPSENREFLVGHVHNATGDPSVGGQVRVSCELGRTVLNAERITGLDGSFQLELPTNAIPSFAVVMALPPESRRELGMLAPDAVPLVRYGGTSRLVSPLVFDLAAPAIGTIVDEFGAGRVAVQVVPCVVDELLGCVLPLVAERTFTGSSGAFRINRLPARLPAHQSLVLLLLHADLEARVVAIPTRASIYANMPLPPIEMRRLRLVRLHMLAANATVEILEEVAGLPAGAGMCKRVATTDSQGRVSALAAGWQPMWLRYGTGANASVRQLLLDQVVGLPQFKPAIGPPKAQDSVFRQLQGVPDSTIEVVSSYRHQTFLTPSANGAAVVVVDAEGRGVSSAQVFAIANTGPRAASDAQFLGFTSSAGVINVGAAGEVSALLVLAADGRMATVSNLELFAGGVVTIELPAMGRALLTESLRPTNGELFVELRLQRLDLPGGGLAPVAVRFAGESSGWEVGDLPPGEYRVIVNQSAFMVVVPPGGWVTIE